MWQQTHTHYYEGLDAQAVWSVWADVDRYTDWHDDLDYCRLNGEFAEGNYFQLKPKGAPVFKVHIVELKPYSRFVDCTNFFGAKMYDIHQCDASPGGVTITSTVKVTGPLSRLWVKLVAKKVADSAAEEMQALVTLARQSA